MENTSRNVTVMLSQDTKKNLVILAGAKTVKTGKKVSINEIVGDLVALANKSREV